FEDLRTYTPPKILKSNPQILKSSNPQIHRRLRRQLDRDGRSPVASLDVQRRSIAEQHPQPALEQIQTMALGTCARVESRAVVLDRDAEAAAGRGGVDRDRRALAPRRHRVFHAVLDERLQRHARHLSRPCAAVDVDGVAQALAEAYP